MLDHGFYSMVVTLFNLPITSFYAPNIEKKFVAECFTIVYAQNYLFDVPKFPYLCVYQPYTTRIDRTCYPSYRHVFSYKILTSTSFTLP